MRTATAVVGGLAIVCAVLPGCAFSAGVNSTPTVSKDDLQKNISDRLTKAGEQPESVTCNEDLVGEVGKTTRCEVVMGPTNSFEPVVTVTGIDGSTINYEMTPALSKDQLEKAVSRLVSDAEGVQVDSVSCESGLEGKVGAVAYCDLDAGEVQLRRMVDVTNVEDLMMNFDVLPVLTQAQVESSLLDELERQVGQRPDSADCTGDLEGKPGNTVDCTIVAGPETTSFTLTVDTVEGSTINYHYEPRS
jgi:Domain of unknown function (DUF4333)